VLIAIIYEVFPQLSPLTSHQSHMKSSLTVWGRRSSFNVQKVLWTLGELSLDYEHRDAGGSFGGLGDPAFLAMNPNGLVPVILDEEGSVWESNSIVRYLCAKHSRGNLWIEDPFARSKADRWIDWAATGLQPSFMRLFWGYYRTPEGQRDKMANQAALSSCIKHFRLLDAHLANNDFLAGSHFTAADIPAGTALHRYFGLGLAVEEPPNVMAWFSRLRDRPAFRQHVLVPFDDLYGRLAF
jgi:glutathione S-transferase